MKLCDCVKLNNGVMMPKVGYGVFQILMTRLQNVSWMR
jgi:hypothetical protein